MSNKFTSGLGLTGNYDLGEMDWHESMNKNLEILNGVDEPHFVSINPVGGNQTEQGNYKNDGAKGIGSIAIGANASTLSDNSVVIGSESGTNGVNIVAIGHAVTASGSFGVAIGNGVNSGFNSIVIGDKCDSSNGNSNIILGRENQVESGQNIIMGHRIKSGNGGACNIILNPEDTETDYSTTAPSWTVRIGTKNTNANTTEGTYGQVVIGNDNQTDGTHNIIIGQDNNNTYNDGSFSNDGFGSITIGVQNLQYGSFNSLLGYENKVVESQTSSHTRAHAIGTNNDISGFECAIVGNENKFSFTGNYQSVNVDGNRNNITGHYFGLSVVGSYNAINAPQDTTGQDVVIAGHNNNVTGAFRQTVIGSNNTIDETATETTVVGFNINAKYSNVTYLGNGATIDFSTASKDYRFFGAPYQFSYLTKEVTYKTNPTLANRNWYTGIEMLALKPNTVITNVADGANDNHAATVRQLKKLDEIQNNDYVLFGRANEYAVYNVLQDSPDVLVTWEVSKDNGNNTLDVTTLSTKAEKEVWITTNFTVIQEILDSQSEVIAKLLKYNGTIPLQIKNTGTSLDGNTELDTLPVTSVLNGGYDALNGVSTVGFLSPINKPANWEINNSLHSITSKTFFLTPA